MGRLRDKFSKLTVKQHAERSPSPASQSASISVQQPPTTSRHVSEKPWNQAYNNLKATESSIVKAYEKNLSDQLNTIESSGANTISSEHATRWRRMEHLVSNSLEKTAKDADRKEKEISAMTKEHAQWQRQEQLDEKDSACLRDLRGDPGKGKTILLAGIIEELETSAPKSVFYFFCQATESRVRTATNVLRGLIWFLVRRRPDLMPHVRKEYDKEGKDAFSGGNAWHTLAEILASVIDDETSNGCIFVVDALDECTTDEDQLIRLIIRLSSSNMAKWVVPAAIIRKLNEGSTECRERRKVDILTRENGYNEATRDEVQKYLLDKSEDTFLWVSLVCKELGKPDVMSHHTLGVLKSFPAGLGKLCEGMMEKSKQTRDKDFCKAALAVIGVAYTPLTLGELAASDARLNGWIENTEALSNIVRSCGLSLTIRDGMVYTVHQSVKDFLRTYQGDTASGTAQKHFDIFFRSVHMMQKHLHRDLYRLNDPGVESDEIEAPESHAIIHLGYACYHWADHFHDGYLAGPRGHYAPGYDLLDRSFREKYLYWLEAMSLH
ncbi:hypothetical protein FLONG3_2449 [Fusarium longipes]|uniref:NACHT domain-containing protein n=1 Tax=Fusarium longipes TaxID=694270 RepID=A0A395T3T1_9HYPO|nr:hypothetical protein FLONG3_2449 [Fusarium longipes]